MGELSKALSAVLVLSSPTFASCQDNKVYDISNTNSFMFRCLDGPTTCALDGSFNSYRVGNPRGTFKNLRDTGYVSESESAFHFPSGWSEVYIVTDFGSTTFTCEPGIVCECNLNNGQKCPIISSPVTPQLPSVHPSSALSVYEVSNTNSFMFRCQDGPTTCALDGSFNSYRVGNPRGTFKNLRDTGYVSENEGAFHFPSGWSEVYIVTDFGSTTFTCEPGIVCECNLNNGQKCPVIFKPFTPQVRPTASPQHNSPTLIPLRRPSAKPSHFPTNKPSTTSSVSPTRLPLTEIPSVLPSQSPSKMITQNPTAFPTFEPRKIPSTTPTVLPTIRTQSPTDFPTFEPSNIPSTTPTVLPTIRTQNPTDFPTFEPSNIPSTTPTGLPTIRNAPLGSPLSEDILCVAFSYELFNNASLSSNDIFNEVNNTLKTGMLIATENVAIKVLNISFSEMIPPEIAAIVDNPLCPHIDNSTETVCSIVSSKVCVLLEEGDVPLIVRGALIIGFENAIESGAFEAMIPPEHIPD